MDTFLMIAQIVAFVCVTAVCIYLLVVLSRLRDMMMDLGKDVKEVTAKTIPVLENVEFVTARLKSITENIDDQVTIIGDSVSSVRDIAENIVTLERKVQERIEGPILDTIALIAAVFKGVRTFVERVRA